MSAAEYVWLAIAIVMAGLGTVVVSCHIVYDAALNLLRRGEYDQALKRLDRIKRFPVLMGPIGFLRGSILMFAGRNQEAEQIFRKCVASSETSPRKSLGLVNLGYVLLEQKRYAESAKALDQAIELRPDGAVAYSTRAEVYLRQGLEIGKALELLDRGFRLKLDSGAQASSDVHMFGYFEANRAWALFLLGRRAEAEQALAQAGEWESKAMAAEHFKPGCAGIRYRMGRALLAAGENDRARDQFRQAMEIDSKGKYAALSRAALRSL